MTEEFKNIDKVFVSNSGTDAFGEMVLEAFNGRIIDKIELVSDVLVIKSGDKYLRISDDGQSCCEHRYMHTEDEDDFDYHIGSVFRFVQIVHGPDGGLGGDVHETMFCDVLTSKGVIQLVCHNEHNGYYGGFSVNIRSNILED